MSKLKRRGFLTGIAGFTVGLPFLESVLYVDRKAHAAGDSPVFTAIFRQANGVQQGWSDEPDRFWPSQTGTLTREILEGRDAGRAVSELASFAEKLTIVSGLNMPFSGGSCGHAMGLAQLLSATEPLVGNRHSRSSGETVDWFIARRCNPAAAPPLHFAAARLSNSYITGTLSYSASNTPHPAQNNPYAVYLDLFGDGGPGEEELRDLRRQSVNDFVRNDIRDLMGAAQLGSADRQRLSDHLEMIRDVELRMCNAFPEDRINRMRELREVATRGEHRIEVMELFMALIATAFSCNQNRIASLQMGNGNDSTRYVVNGQTLNSYHRISHRIDSDGGRGAAIENADIMHHEIDRIHARLFRYLLEQLEMRSGPSGGTLLDDSVNLWVNDLSNGPPHSIRNMPFVMAGGAGGFLRTGQYVNSSGTHNKFLNTLISAHGIQRDGGGHYDSFGDSGLDRGVIDEVIR